MNISVAMCTYNGARFLQAQLESIAAQKRLPDELVICDDCSADQTLKIVRAFMQGARFPVRLEVSATNLGSTKNFENAIHLCQGDIIALADQYDVWHPEKLSRIVEAFERDKSAGAVFTDAELIDADSRPQSKTLWSSSFFNSREQDKFDQRQELRVMLKHPVVTGATMAFRSEFRGLLLPIPPKQIHDHWIGILIASVSHLTPIREPLVEYRKHDAQQIGPWEVDSLWQQIQVSKRANRDYLGESERFNEVYERLCDCSAAFRPHVFALHLISQKINHQRTRGTLPNSKLLRLAALLREVVTLRYWRYSNGLGSVAKDLLV